jgi:hypothetical protein
MEEFAEKKSIISRNSLSVALKTLTILNAFVGIILSFVYASEEGYSSWYIRAAYFTLQSNFWISGLMLFMLILPFTKLKVKEQTIYMLKFVFTVSITLTFIVFWTLLAPFAYKENYNPWSASSMTTHMFAPAFAIIDFFVDKKQIEVTKKHVFGSLLPPLAYFVFASVLCLFKVDFGRGDPYPYFFMDYYSAAGLFGYVEEPFVLGTAYWIIIIMLVVLAVAAVLKAAYRAVKRRER